MEKFEKISDWAFQIAYDLKMACLIICQYTLDAVFQPLFSLLNIIYNIVLQFSVKPDEGTNESANEGEEPQPTKNHIGFNFNGKK